MAANDCYVYWTNKGGVGKTTLCFHSAITYAEANPTANVIAIDMDEQANLSQTMLTSIGNEATGEEYIAGTINCAGMRDSYVNGESAYSRTICGLLLATSDKDVAGCTFNIPSGPMLEKEACFLVNLAREGYNPNLPQNLWLLCGDPRIVTLVPKFQALLSAPGALDQAAGARDSDWAKINKLLQTFITKVSKQIPGGATKPTITFIDTNPSLSIWTQMALTAGDKLIVPVNADDFSTAAISNMFFTVYGLYSYGPSMEKYEKTMFSTVAKGQGIAMPKIHAIVHNRSSIHGEAPKGAFAAMNHGQAHALFAAFNKAKVKGEQAQVFSMKGDTEPRNVAEFVEQFTGVMRDMQGSGVATTHGGIPMWMVRRHNRNIKASLQGKVEAVTISATSSMLDFIGAEKGEQARKGGLLGLITGNEVDAEIRGDFWAKFNTTAAQAYG